MNKTNAELAQYLTDFFANYQASDGVDVVICPQMLGIATAMGVLPKDGVMLGAQTMHPENSGAFTGETSPVLLKECGCEYVILGHSERRTLFHESNEIVNKKMTSALAHGLRPILCVGETLEQREQGKAIEVVETQLNACLADLDASKVDVAYEPVWSIGTGKIPSKEDILEMHALIRRVVKNNESRILYGGSSNDQNAAELIQIPEVNGFLVGGASLDPTKFLKMIDIMAHA